MSIKRVNVAFIAAFGLSMTAYTALADPLSGNAGTPGVQNADSSLALFAAQTGEGGGGGGHGPGGVAGHGPGGGGGGGMHPGGGGAMNHPGGGGMHPGGGEHFPGRHAGDWHGHGHGYWRDGHWYWGAPVIYGGGCYSRCIGEGFGPYYCRSHC